MPPSRLIARLRSAIAFRLRLEVAQSAAIGVKGHRNVPVIVNREAVPDPPRKATTSSAGRTSTDQPKLMGGPGYGGISAAGTAEEQQMDQPSATAGQQFSGNPLIGPGQITAAAGCDHERTTGADEGTG